MTRLVPANIDSLAPYQPGMDAELLRRRYGFDRVVKLASNENPLGPSPKAIEAAARSLAAVHRYPTGGRELREVLAQRFGVRMENVIAGSGSEGIMANIMRTFLCDDDEVLATDCTFIGFKVLAQSRGIAYRTVPYRSDWHHDLKALADSITEHTKIIYIANPDNPTGTIITRSEFDEFYKRVPQRVLIILDEAYIEYTASNPEFPDSLLYRYDNVITLRTFSKIYGLAGMRVGYGFAHDELIRNLLKVKLPFEPSTPAQAAAIAALEDDEFVARTRDLNANGLEFLQRTLPQMGLTPVVSSANFVLLPMASDAEAADVMEEMLKRGVILRHLTAFGLPYCLRVSTGTREELDIFADTLNSVLEVQHAAGVKAD